MHLQLKHWECFLKNEIKKYQEQKKKKKKEKKTSIFCIFLQT